jgi:hypothetical protein
VHGSFGRGFCDATCDGSESGLESAERWSKWQDLNLRPPRPERGVPPDRAAPIFRGSRERASPARLRAQPRPVGRSTNTGVGAERRNGGAEARV